MKRIFIYLILALFIAESSLEGIKLFMDNLETTELAVEIEDEDINSEKDKEKKDREDLCNEQIAFEQQIQSLKNTYYSHFKEFENFYEKISLSVPTPPPDNFLERA